MTNILNKKPVFLAIIAAYVVATMYIAWHVVAK